MVPDTAFLPAGAGVSEQNGSRTSQLYMEAMLKGELLPAKKPDIDNIAKVVLDALNSVAYRDDTQVVELQLRKQYSEKPRVEICMEELEV